ncbi:hypothetical protein PsorP6_017622 [Peronosclerospora sorghi]|uniref:Uncharacterized protein n=1 Tax=Peronosclerospora sorghi TaxID=230839 RepID=A0ACC0WP23_9STRA|nr:hypothetical protein PsorP6_017622 [Peronosclerospora sorghi]
MERDLPEHMARLYVAGYNDPDSKLKLRTTVPPSLKQVLYDAEFRHLAERINRVLAWKRGAASAWTTQRVKFGYYADYFLVYLEILYEESSQSVCVPTTKIGKPSLPLVLLFAGCGNYFSPFYLDPNELLVQSIPQCPELKAFIDEPWIEVVAELNELLRVLQRNEDSLV